MSPFPFLPYSHSFRYPSLFHSYVLSIFSFSPWSLFVLVQFYSMSLVSTCMTRFFFPVTSSSPVSSPHHLVPGPPSTPQGSAASRAPSSQNHRICLESLHHSPTLGKTPISSTRFHAYCHDPPLCSFSASMLSRRHTKPPDHLLTCPAFTRLATLP